MTTGERIYIARKRSGLTQKELGEKLGVSASMIGQYENGFRNPKKKTLERIADALGVSWEELYVFSIEAEQARKLDEIEEIKKQLETAEGKKRTALEYALEVLMESYEDVTLLDALQGSMWEELVPEIRQGDGRRWQKMSDAEAYRAGFLQFHSEEDRIAHFYQLLNEDGKLAASGCFYRHLDKDTLKEVADFVLNLSENPLYQRHTPTDAPQSPQAAQEDTATEAPQRPQEDET